MQRPRHLFLARATMTLLLALFTSIGAWATITGSGDKYDPYVLNTAEDWTTAVKTIATAATAKTPEIDFAERRVNIAATSGSSRMGETPFDMK